MRCRSRRQVKRIFSIFKAVVMRDPDADLYFEWPTNAYLGWKIRPTQERTTRLLKMFNKEVYFCCMNVCMFRVCNRESHLLKKPWTIMTTDASFYQHAARTCDGKHDHVSLAGAGNKAVNGPAFAHQSWHVALFRCGEGLHCQSSSKQIVEQLLLLERLA